MSARSRRGNFGKVAALIPAGLAVLTAAQAVAINVATSLLPKSWDWASKPVLAWSIVGVLIAVAVFLLIASNRAALHDDYRNLTVRDEFLIQPTMILHSKYGEQSGSSAIRWFTPLAVDNAGDRVISMSDIEPIFPERRGEARVLPRLQLVRRSRAGHAIALSGIAEWADGQRIEDEVERSNFWFARRREFPLLLQPGSRLLLLVEHEYEFRLNGQVMTFEDDSKMAEVLAAYLDLYDEEAGRITAQAVYLKCRIDTGRGSTIRELPFLLTVPGSALRMPGPEETDQVLHDRQLGDME